jgi:predicted deacylase
MRRWAGAAIALVLAGSTAVALAAAPDQTTPAPRTFKLGESVRGREIRATEIGDPAAARKILVFGAIHGDEHAGVAIARELAKAQPIDGVDLWIVPNLNPDGARAHTRQNARVCSPSLSRGSRRS